MNVSLNSPANYGIRTNGADTLTISNDYSCLLTSISLFLGSTYEQHMSSSDV